MSDTSISTDIHIRNGDAIEVRRQRKSGTVMISLGYNVHIYLTDETAAIDALISGLLAVRRGEDRRPVPEAVTPEAVN